ncbi:MAG: MFS transporter [Dehalococcoidales bacterium]|nr:MFS transporter [Dehalococcoidales bacterium]
MSAIIIYLVQGSALELSLKSYQWIVIIGTVPAVLGVLVLLIFVREREKKTLPKDSGQQDRSPGIKAVLDTRFKIFLVILGVFTLGKSSDFFVILRAQNLEVPLIQVILMLVLFNIICSLVSLPVGILSDRIGRKRLITAGWFIYVLVYLGFALASRVWQAWFLFAGYGIYFGMVEGVGRAFVADLVPAEKRGTAYGLYHGVNSLALLPASLIAGWLWQAISPAATFYFGASLAFLAMAGIITLVKE